MTTTHVQCPHCDQTYALTPDEAPRYAGQMRVRVLALTDDWARRDLQICVRRFDDLPGFAKDLVTLLERDARDALAQPGEIDENAGIA